MKRQAYYILDPDDAIQPGDRVNQGTIYLRPVPDAVTLDDGWVPWSGGECPVDPNVRVQVKFIDGATRVSGTPARCVDWSRGGLVSFYKVIEPAPKQPLTCDDVPPGSVFRRSAPDGHPSDIVYLIPTGVFQDSVQFFVNEKPCAYTWESISHLPQWQIKRPGEEWKPCCK